MKKILAINPGSTSTKIGVFKRNEKLFEQVLRHSNEQLDKYQNVIEQYAFRKDDILAFLQENNVDLKDLEAIACRGGITKPIKGGTYLVNDAVCEMQRNSPLQHPSSLAAIIGKELADELEIKAYFVDSPMTYEMEEIASYSGHKEIKRPGRFHALNQKAIARKYAEDIGRSYEDLRLVVCHMGGGFSIAAHREGLAVDVVDALEEGPFTPERAGALPTRQLIDLCFSGKYTHGEMKKFIQGEGGLNSYLGINDCKEVADKSEEIKEYQEVLEAMCYQVAKEIGSMATVLSGKVDAIILTGGIAYSKKVCDLIKARVTYISEVIVYQGERELEALAEGVVRVLEEKEEAQEFK